MDSVRITERISIDKIDPNPYVTRISSPDIDDLIASFKIHGQLSPIMVRPSFAGFERYDLVFGQRRLLAAKALHWNDIMATVVPISNERMILNALAENQERNGFSDYEVGLILKRLREQFGKSIAEIACGVGKSPSYVSQHIAMIE